MTSGEWEIALFEMWAFCTNKQEKEKKRAKPSVAWVSVHDYILGGGFWRYKGQIPTQIMYKLKQIR